MERHIKVDKDASKLKFNQNRRRHIEEPLVFCLFNAPGYDAVEKSSTDLNGNFVYSQLLIEILLHMPLIHLSSENEFIEMCKNECELAVVKEFEESYSSDRAIWWYSRETFLYRLLNTAFRVHDFYLLYMFRFFICDLYQQLEKLHTEQQEQLQSCSIHLYRAQVISTDELLSIENQLGQYISTNSFLSTTLDREYAMFLLESLTMNSVNKTLTRVLFEIKIECDDTIMERKRPFADITRQSIIPDEKEVLFTPCSIFHLTEILHQNHISFTIIRMTLSSLNEIPVNPIYDYRHRQLEVQGYTCTTLGKICWQMGRFDQAERFFNRAMQDSNLDRILSYRNLANTIQERGDYSLSLVLYKKFIKLRRQVPFDVLADTYNSLGVVYHQMGNLKRARQCYNRTMHMWRRAYGIDCEQIGDYFNNMGLIYFEKKNYNKALRQYRMSLAIRHKYVPVDHPYIAATYINIGNIHAIFSQFDVALTYYELALNIQCHSKPIEHPSIALTQKNIDIISSDEKKISDLKYALCHFRQA